MARLLDIVAPRLWRVLPPRGKQAFYEEFVKQIGNDFRRRGVIAPPAMAEVTAVQYMERHGMSLRGVKL